MIGMAWIGGMLAGAGITGAVMYARFGQLKRAMASQETRGQMLEDAHAAQLTKAAQLEEALRGESVRCAGLEVRAARLDAVEQEMRSLSATLGALEAEKARLTERLAHEEHKLSEKTALFHESEQRMLDVFKSLSHDVLRENNELFLNLAHEKWGALHETAQHELALRQKAIDDLVRPLQESLQKVDGRVGEIEKARIEAYSALETQLRALLETHLPMLREETAKLVKALRQPAARGLWGEAQLRRVVEMAGMLEHCDFSEQVSVTDDETRRQRPDMLIHLPGGKHIVVDAKAPLAAYLEAVEAKDEPMRQACLAQHTQQLKKHIQMLGQKTYWAQFQPTPEFVILFLPGEAFLSAAFQEDPQLLEFAVAYKVIPSTPTTLIALLKAVAYGWQQESLAENARHISQMGHELYERLARLGEHWAKVGKGLEAATKAYNDATGSLESRVWPSLQRLRDLQGIDKALPLPGTVDLLPRSMQRPEMQGTPPPAADAVGGATD